MIPADAVAEPLAQLPTRLELWRAAAGHPYRRNPRHR